MDDKFIFIPRDDKQNYPFCRLRLLVKRFGSISQGTKQSKLIKVSKLFVPANKMTLFVNFVY